MNLLDQPLGEIASSIPGATRVFHDYGLDFCCGGHVSLRAAATVKNLDADAIAARLKALLAGGAAAERDWSVAPAGELIDHILARFHDTHRAQLPELIRLAERVEHVHGGKSACPRGLAAHLQVMLENMESHMQKEEQVLFPLLAQGHGAMAGGPIAVMRMEHDQHGEALEQLAALTQDLTLPPEACNTWTALYNGLRSLREDLMEHIHLENHILFANAGAGTPAYA